MKRMATPFLTSVLLLLTLLFSSNTLAQPSAVYLPGTFQAEYGCNIWMADCEATRLAETSEGVWESTFIIPAGEWWFKVAYNGNWTENYGANGVLGGENIQLTLAAKMQVHFSYSEATHLVSIKSAPALDVPKVILAGDFQSELGCPADWLPDCTATMLYWDAATARYRGSFRLPAGNWAFKVTVGGSWSENYGAGGVPGGANILLNLPIPSRVTFEYNHQTHLVAYTITPETVVIPANFQSELGCTPDQLEVGGDWEPGCDATRLTWDAANQLWKGTFVIPAGDWEYKVALNNMWNENYGLYGIPGGPNIPLSVEKPVAITFIYDPLSHRVSLVYAQSDLCAVAFYDANANGYKDWNEETLMDGVVFSLWGKTTATQYSGSDGKACFTDLPAGVYTIESTVPGGYLPTVDSQTINLTQPSTLYFGQVCLGGAGARDIGFWMNKHGQGAFERSWSAPYLLQWMSYLNLRNADGSRFVPESYAQLQTWLQQANAKNMAYKVSAQLAVLFLNLHTGMVGWDRMVYTPGIRYWWYPTEFMSVDALINYTSNQLAVHARSFGGDANRYPLESLKNLLELVNGDSYFVQQQPCGSAPVTRAKKQVVAEKPAGRSSAAVWPNPSGAHFSLRPAANGVEGIVQVRVLDVAGKLVYATSGSAQKEYRFGEGFKPGLYFVEITQGTRRSTLKVVKQ